MKINLLFLAAFISIKVSAQNDTIIYYSNSGGQVPTIKEAVDYTQLVSSSKDKFSLLYFSKVQDKWQNKSVTKIKRQSDSSFLMTSEVKTLRIYHKSDSGFIIKDFQDSKLIKEGFSKLIFPLIKSGTWRSCSPISGTLEGEETYNNNQLIAYKYWITDSSFIQDIFRLIDVRPQYIGGDSALMSFVSKNLRYPMEAYRRNIQDRVLVKFIVSSDGHVLGPKVINKVDKFLGREAIRVVSLMQNGWIPAKSGDINVMSFFVIPITFQIKDRPN